VVLVDNNCASSCEFFAQFLQTNHRAQVVSQYATEGAGGPIDRIKMPNGITFQYTKGRSYFAGTDELNLEVKGVTPDVKVPVTEETEMAKRQGGDPVLDAGIATPNKSAFQNLELQSATYADGVITSVAPVGWTYNPSIQVRHW
jgi:C-terminal processing protease CtpA/Prc